MNFASWSFIGVFLPLALTGFFVCPVEGNYRRNWLILVSSLFYANTGLVSSAILAVSIAINFSAGQTLSTGELSQKGRLATLWLAIVANVFILAAFKVAALQSFSGGSFVSSEQVLLPLGLSFITFQQIGYVVSCYRREFSNATPGDYLFFVLFFPQLIMGPIVRFADMTRQVHAKAFAAVSLHNFAVGLAIFMFGLAKKVLLADALNEPVDRVFRLAETGFSTPDAYFAAIGFQLQLFLDFTAYAEMSIGLARIFNISLPIGFDRPLHAISRFDLWSRWNITFVMFMREHVFLPLVRTAGLPIPAALAITGIISGLWHGLGWTFVMWGLVQTLLLLASNARSKFARRTGKLSPLTHIRAIAATFAVTCLVGILFRAGSLEGAVKFYLTLIPDLRAPPGISLTGPYAWGGLLLCAFVGWFMPDARSFFTKYWTAVDPRRGGAGREPARTRWQFDLNYGWGTAAALVMIAVLMRLETSQRFIYVQF